MRESNDKHRDTVLPCPPIFRGFLGVELYFLQNAYTSSSFRMSVTQDDDGSRKVVLAFSNVFTHNPRGCFLDHGSYVDRKMTSLPTLTRIVLSSEGRRDGSTVYTVPIQKMKHRDQRSTTSYNICVRRTSPPICSLFNRFYCCRRFYSTEGRCIGRIINIITSPIIMVRS